MTTIGNRIKQAMNDKGISQNDIVKHTGINKGSLSCYISGRYLPKQNTIYKLAKYLDVSPYWLMGYENEEDQIILNKLKSLSPNQKKSIINIIDNMNGGL